MKTSKVLKRITFAFLVAVFGALVFTSCSKEGDVEYVSSKNQSSYTKTSQLPKFVYDPFFTEYRDSIIAYQNIWISYSNKLTTKDEDKLLQSLRNATSTEDTLSSVSSVDFVRIETLLNRLTFICDNLAAKYNDFDGLKYSDNRKYFSSLPSRSPSIIPPVIPEIPIDTTNLPPLDVTACRLQRAECISNAYDTWAIATGVNGLIFAVSGGGSLPGTLAAQIGIEANHIREKALCNKAFDGCISSLGQ